MLDEVVLTSTALECEHWMRTSTELLCGEGRTNCWYATIPLRRVFLLPKRTLSRWIVDAITVAYESSDLPSPLGVKAHTIRSMAASKVFLAGVHMQDICDTAGWSTPLTFVRFYDLDLQATSGSSVLLP